MLKNFWITTITVIIINFFTYAIYLLLMVFGILNYYELEEDYKKIYLYHCFFIFFTNGCIFDYCVYKEQENKCYNIFN